MNSIKLVKEKIQNNLELWNDYFEKSENNNLLYLEVVPEKHFKN